ncbi:MFS transporter [Streptococcus ruminantium]|uniref:MFS transporter n=1 Tax=Streptococcus ruminantium TaxID=1917441 RepID=UPI0012DFC9CA|nr:MFS transporter [Streptococcus ruminantium]
MNKPLTPKQISLFFVAFYSLACAFAIYSYLVKEPFTSIFLLNFPIILCSRQCTNKEERHYFFIQNSFAVVALVITYGIGIWLGSVKPLLLIFPALFAIYLLYRFYFQKDQR